MLRGLKSGEFDEVIERFKASNKGIPKASEAAAVSKPTAVEKQVVQDSKPASPRPVVAPVASPQAPIGGPPAKAPTPPAPEQGPAPAVGVSLVEVILSYLVVDEE